jgi:fused signal recognition particle receptor
MPWLFLVLAVIVVVFGVGVLLLGRRSAAKAEPARPVGRPAAERPTGPPPRSAIATAPVAEDDSVAITDEELEAEALAAVPFEDIEPSGAEPEAFERPRFRDRLARARASFAGAFTSIRGRAGITEQTFEELEDALIGADVGVKLTTELVDGLRAAVRDDKLTDPEVLLERLKATLEQRLERADRGLRYDGAPGHPDVWLFVGVNGVGKTTTIGKIGARQRSEGRRVLMAAGDTFRAAAAEQLTTWAERAGAELVRGDEGADPAAIIFDGVERASARGIGLVLADTAGRLHTKTNLMEELRKVRRVAEKGAGVVTEVLLVVDATTGQNGLVQAKQFTEAVEVTGVVLTKLDGSAKGGIVLAIEHELSIPVKLVGLGEGIGDLTEFDPVEFVDALFA